MHTTSTHTSAGRLRAALVAGIACALVSVPLIAPLGAHAATTDITINAVGDICFSGGSGQSLGSPRRLLAASKATLRRADITYGNLETPLSSRGSKWPNKSFNFRGPLSAAPALRSAGFDVLSGANNHALDYGRTAFNDTRRVVKKNGMAYVGGGANIRDAWAPRIITVKGKKVAFIAYSEITPTGFAATAKHSGTAYLKRMSQATSAVRAAAKQADYVVVAPHWGIEKKYDPSKRQVNEAHALIRAGADVVLGSHPHRIQGVEYYRNGVIAYSLGNYVFSGGSSASHDTMILKVTLAGGKVKSASTRPVRIVNAAPKVMKPTSSSGKRITGIIKRTSAKRGTRAVVKGSSISLRK